MRRFRLLLVFVAVLLQSLLPVSSIAHAAIPMASQDMAADCDHAHTSATDAQHHQAAHIASCCAHGHCDCATACSATALPVARLAPPNLRTSVPCAPGSTPAVPPIRSTLLLRPPIAFLS